MNSLIKLFRSLWNQMFARSWKLQTNSSAIKSIATVERRFSMKMKCINTTASSLRCSALYGVKTFRAIPNHKVTCSAMYIVHYMAWFWNRNPFNCDLVFSFHKVVNKSLFIISTLLSCKIPNLPSEQVHRLPFKICLCLKILWNL